MERGRARSRGGGGGGGGGVGAPLPVCGGGGGGGGRRRLCGRDGARVAHLLEALLQLAPLEPIDELLPAQG